MAFQKYLTSLQTVTYFFFIQMFNYKHPTADLGDIVKELTENP